MKYSIDTFMSTGQQNPHLIANKRDQRVFFCEGSGVTFLVIGPFFYSLNLNSKIYFHILQNKLENMLHILSLTACGKFSK